NKDYLVAQGESLVEVLGRRLPGSRPRIDSLPQEATYTSAQLGEPQFPVWAEDADPAGRQLDAGNVHFENSENRETHAADEIFDRQIALRHRLVKWWQAKQQSLKSQAAKGEVS